MKILEVSVIMIIVYRIALQPIRNKKKRNKYFLILVGIQLILLFALRDFNVGVDIIRYKRTYDEYSNLSFFEVLKHGRGLENMGYSYFNYFFGKLGFSYQQFLGIIGIIAVVPMMYCIYTYSDYPLLSVLVYLSIETYSFQFSGLKQTIAMSLVIIALVALIERKKIKFYLFVLFAILFHPTAIVFLPIYWICTSNNKKAIGLLLTLIVLLSFVFRLELGELAMKIYDSDYLGRYSSMGSVGGMTVFLLFILLYVVFFLGRYVTSNNKIESIYFKLLCVGVSIQFLSSYAYAFTRINYYYIQFLPIIISKMVEMPRYRFKQRTSMVVSLIVWIMFFVLCLVLYRSQIVDGVNTYNYQFFMEAK